MSEYGSPLPPYRFAIVWVFLLALSQVLPSAGEFGPPEQIHLSWSDSAADHVSVTWVTNTPAPDSRVAFARRSEPETEIRERRATLVADDPSLFLHTASFGPLDPGTIYRYRVGSDTTGWSSSFRLRTRPGAEDRVTFAAVADMGVGGRAFANTARMVEEDPDLVLHAGDLSYAWRHPWRWNAFFQMIQPLATSALYMTAPGNHEHLAPLGMESYLSRLTLPNNELYYSFDYGPLHVISLDSGAEYAAPSEEITSWLEADLRHSVESFPEAWIVAFFHFPPFTSGGHGSWMEGRSRWGPLFERFGVSLVISGHSHLYERTWPVYASGEVTERSYEDPQAPVYVITGGGGEKLYALGQAVPDWSAFRASVHETLLVTVEGNVMTVEAVRPDGERLDAFSLVRSGGTRLKKVD